MEGANRLTAGFVGGAFASRRFKTTCLDCDLSACCSCTGSFYVVYMLHRLHK